jgi:hypothetical protein
MEDYDGDLPWTFECLLLELAGLRHAIDGLLSHLELCGGLLLCEPGILADRGLGQIGLVVGHVQPYQP